MTRIDGKTALAPFFSIPWGMDVKPKEKRPADTAVVLPGNPREQQVLQYALDRGFTDARGIARLRSWLRENPVTSKEGSSPLLVEFCEDLPREQVQELWTLYQESEEQRNSEGSVLADCLRRLEEIHTERPLFSPHAEIFLDIKEKIGEGGMGTVYRVHDRRIGRDAALKIINQSLPEHDEFVRRFIREAKITAYLDHPSIPPIYELGTNSDGQHFILMRLIQGQELTEVIEDFHKSSTPDMARRRFRELIEILIGAGNAVSFAHHRGILHRDLKPENIMVSGFQEVLVLDWGLAKIDQIQEKQAFDGVLKLEGHDLELDSNTSVGAVMGTRGYMSPEQSAASHSVTAQSDLYSLGAILFEILTGQPPNSQETGKIKLSPSAKRACASKEVKAIAEAALAHDLSKRTASVEVFVSDLRHYLNGSEVSVYTYSVRERWIRFARQRPLVLMGAPILAIFLLCAGLFLIERSVSAEKLQAADKEIEAREVTLKELHQSINALAQADHLARRGLPLAPIRVKIQEALKLRNDHPKTLLSAAKIYQRGGFQGPMKSLLIRAAQKDKDAFEALFLLHTLEVDRLHRDFLMTRPLEEILNRSDRSEAPGAYALFAKGTKQLTEKRWNDALKSFNQVEQLSRRLPWLYLSRAHALSQLGRPRAAESDLRRSLELNPRFARSYLHRGRLRIRDKNFSGALEDLNLAIQIQPKYSLALNERALLHWKEKRLADALMDFTRALAVTPNWAEIYFNRGRLYLERSDHSRALQDLTRALSLDPQFADAYAQRGELYFLQEDGQKSLEDYNRAIEINPLNPLYFLNRGNSAQFLKRDLLAALADYNKAITLNTKNASFHVNRANVLVELKRAQDALKSYNEALKINSSLIAARLNRGLLLSRLGEHQKSLEDFNFAIKNAPQFADSYLARAELYKTLGRLDDAAQDWRTVLDLEPKAAIAEIVKNKLNEVIGENR